jgi:hypothetical protein
MPDGSALKPAAAIAIAIARNNRARQPNEVPNTARRARPCSPKQDHRSASDSLLPRGEKDN